MFYMWWMQTTYWYSAVYQKRGQAPVWKVLWDWLCQGEWQDNALSLASKEGEKDGVILSLCRSKLTPLPPPPPKKKGPKSRLEVICFDLFGKLELAIGAFLSQDLINNLPCFLLYRFREFGIRLTNYPLIDVLIFYSHHLPASYCISLVRRNSVLVTHGNWRVKNFSGRDKQILGDVCFRDRAFNFEITFIPSYKVPFSSLVNGQDQCSVNEVTGWNWLIWKSLHCRQKRKV